jgi:hypothetical protein
MLTLSGLVTYIHRNGAKHEEQLYQYMFQEFDAIAHTEAERDQVILLLRTHYDMEYIKETSMYNHKLALPDLNIIPFRP